MISIIYYTQPLTNLSMLITYKRSFYIKHHLLSNQTSSFMLSVVQIGNIAFLIIFSRFHVVIGKVANVEFQRSGFYFLILILNISNFLNGLFGCHFICFLYF